ncbi:3,4-dihydroxy-2-butanone-4-phosphate synthase [bacterium endosymbiont of Pedicinus badii]|uniref:3,4-dihydroxy-2-butanone-4-phosphate synthase n=1 Tax=bacterium endosymbiont of Pedicinus badii TaxID=1719126 RepID=UPI0009BB3D48|nr:3,4-dihydroxy-2-butanone-4-phosphate synthase [bacterium endosymbiont of Pedicinus badii]OQM34166.1 3,4-dihydroxy-2-butanone 4-phosphate synthase [bacterium endosymbiont of Pedicinus badii]
MKRTFSKSLKNSIKIVENAIYSLKKGKGIFLFDDYNRENEWDIVFAAENMVIEQMAFTIRYGSGIVCLCLTEEKVKQLNLPMMVKENNSKYQTPFTITIEAAKGVTTGVSAKDRITTIKTAINDLAKPSDLNKPGHVFPLKANPKGIFGRIGHTEAALDLVKLSGLKPASVICELTNDDGTMASFNEVNKFSVLYDMPMLKINNLIDYMNHTKIL